MVDFRFSAEQQELAGAVRRFFAAKAPEAEVRRAMLGELGHDPALWSRMSSELGLPGLAIPEKYGGGGFTYLELGIVLQEMGRALVCAPFFSSAVLAASALLNSGDEAAMTRWLPRIASGELLATVALPRHSNVRATSAPDGWTLDGVAEFVLDGVGSELVLVAAQSDSGLLLVSVEAPAPGLTRQRVEVFDATRRVARLEFSATPGELVGDVSSAVAALERTADLAAIALAAECVGVAERALEMATDYAKLREQFGRPIGSFQAIKHRLATVLVEIEAARSAAWYALWSATARPDETPVVAALTLATCTETAYLAASENVQVHGGIGYTWEHPAHLYLRRATMSRLLLGDPAEQREALLRRLDY
jgi:alkylation response protein AidB-like acyl-CoA dehydrogenase